MAVTLDRGAARADLTGLLRLFPGTVEVPPLRHHSEDLRDLVPFFLGKLSQQGRVTCSPAATQLLLRHTWPGNAAQLWTVLRQVVQRRRVGQIMPEDLPPECWTVSRRVLSPLESIERDAIVQSLLDHGGNKIRAAAGARHVAGDDLPADSRVRDHHVAGGVSRGTGTAVAGRRPRPRAGQQLRTRPSPTPTGLACLARPGYGS